MNSRIVLELIKGIKYQWAPLTWKAQVGREHLTKEAQRGMVPRRKLPPRGGSFLSLVAGPREGKP